MNARQQVVTALVSLLMLATFALMPSQTSKPVPEVRRAGKISAAPANRSELPADQVRDLAY
ncbi:MAG TPA: hypothetical protein VFD95_11260 [Usitatibacter sp.]|jgi:hypothetical protein|nr:hypothetical protein [Usitatibacter sp.]